MIRARRAVIASLRERARRAEAEQARRVDDTRRAERTRIAREMHDVLAHRLSLLATFAGALEYHPDAPPEQLSRAAGEIRASTHQALDELREVIGVLRDDGAARVDGERTERPQPTIADLPRLVQESRDGGMSVQVDDRIADAAVADNIGRTTYRVIQEALTNARKHASGSAGSHRAIRCAWRGLGHRGAQPRGSSATGHARDTRKRQRAHRPRRTG